MLTGKLATPENSWWGCAVRFSKSWPYLGPKNVRQQWPLLVSISVYPKAREKRSGDEIESISRHHRIYESPCSSVSLTDKKKTHRKSTCLRQNIIKNFLLFTLYTWDLGKGAYVCAYRDNMAHAESPCPSLARTSSTLIQFCQANNYYKTTECTNWSRKTPVRHQEWPHLSIKISSLSAVINIACKLSPVSELLYLSNLEINVSLMYSK